MTKERRPKRKGRAPKRGVSDRSAAILAAVIDKYIGSLHFNGLAIRELKHTPTLGKDIEALILAGAIDLVRGDVHSNPHIKAFPADKPAEQLAKIAAEGLGNGCLYPTPNTLARVVQREDYRDRPFSLELALGAAQLEFRAFDLRSLEYYRNDPRFEYRVDDIHGSIICKDEYFDKNAPPQDQLIMDRFGFCYSDDDRRGVAVFLWDLHKLDGEQQEHWKRYVLSGNYKLHPDYYRTSMLGQFPDGISIFDAFLEEKHQINIMCGLMAKPPLFRSMYKSHDRPGGFGFLIRPTQKELRAFVLLLDQLMSDDLNRDFFANVDLVDTGKTASGKVIRQAKGSIQALEEWIGATVRFNDPKPKDEMLKTFRDIRKQRQKPAHKIEKDVFDETFFDAQRDLIMAAYVRVRTIRLMLSNHPAVRSHQVPGWLDKAKLWTR